MRPTPETLSRLGEALTRAGLTVDEDEGEVFLSESQAAERLGYFAPRGEATRS